MEANRENVKRSLEQQWKDWEYYWKTKEEVGHDFVVRPRELTDNLEGCMVYVQLQAGYPHEVGFGHWCYVVRDLNSKLFVIPSTHCSDKEPNQFDYDIVSIDENNQPIMSRLKLTDAKWVDSQRLDARREVLKVLTRSQYILEKFHKTLGGK